MQRHVLVVSDSVPHRLHGGGGIVVYTIARCLQEEGWKVSILALASSVYNGNGDMSEADHVAHLESLGIRCVILPPPREPIPVFDGRSPRGHYQQFFPAFRHSPDVVRAVEEIAPDVLCVYHWPALAACHDVRNLPKVGLVIDPAHLPALFRKQFNTRMETRRLSPIQRWRQWREDRRRSAAMEEGMADLLNGCQKSAAMAGQHARMFQAMGATRCRYTRAPIPLPASPARSEVNPEMLRILHIGHLQGTATLSGVEFLVDHIMPELDRMIGSDRYEVHVVGGFVETLPGPLRAKLNHPSIRLRGQITDSEPEFTAAHLLLVPIPINLGMRVRILTAFSTGCAVVAHPMNAEGIPELENAQNCLLSDTGRGMAEACVRVFREPVLRRSLEVAGLKTYTELFAPGPVGKAISGLLSRAIAEFSGKAALSSARQTRVKAAPSDVPLPKAPKRQGRRSRRVSKKFRNLVEEYRRFGSLMLWYALPFWRRIVAIIAMSMIVSFSTMIVTGLTAATINALTGLQSAPSAHPASWSSLSDMNLGNIGDLTQKALHFSADKPLFEKILCFGVAILIVTFFQKALQYGLGIVTSWTTLSMSRNMQFDLFSHMLVFPISFFSKHRSGELISRITSNTDKTIREMAQVVVIICTAPLLLAFYSILTIKASWLLFAGIIAAGVFHFGISGSMQGPIKALVRRTMVLGANFYSTLQESFSNIRMVKTFSTEAFEEAKIKENMRLSIKADVSMAVVVGIESPSRSLVNTMVQLMILAVAAWEMHEGRINAPTCLLFIFICQSFVQPINQLGTAYVCMQRMMAGSRRVYQYFELVPEIRDGPREDVSFDRAIEIRDLTFAYDKRAVLNGITLTIEKGETVALVGPSGGGKSTLSDLVLRLQDPTRGGVYLDGVDIREFKQASYRRLFGVVSQEAFLFNTTILENVRIGRENVTEDDVAWALRQANAEEFVSSLPMGMETLIGDRGVRLSGGQKQRISIARAIVGHPRILVMDEATSSLDSESEGAVQEAITQVTESCTSIIIAHRFSTILHADKIVVLHHGKIVGVGPHHELIDSCPLYRRLYETQFKPGREKTTTP